MTEYACEICGQKVTRDWNVPYFLVSCTQGCGFTRHINTMQLDDEDFEDEAPSLKTEREEN